MRCHYVGIYRDSCDIDCAIGYNSRCNGKVTWQRVATESRAFKGIVVTSDQMRDSRNCRSDT